MAKMSEHEMYTRLSRARLEHRLYAGSQWKHTKSGNLYRLVDVVYIEADMSLAVTYCRWPARDTEVAFCRPLTEFTERFVPTRV